MKKTFKTIITAAIIGAFFVFVGCERSSKLNTNTIEGYWSNIKNGIRGNYRSLSKKYLPFYLVEYDYKYNNRNNKSKLFEDFMVRALTYEACMLNYKPTKDSKEVVYG